MAEGYRDRWIHCDDEAVVVRGYYFPWGGSKRIPYGAIRGIRRGDMGTWRGQWRIWGTSNPRYWASWDPGRRHKEVGFVLDLGGRVSPFVTPEDPDRFEAVLRARTGLGGGGEEDRRAPVV